jgi:hypothetical protein
MATLVRLALAVVLVTAVAGLGTAGRGIASPYGVSGKAEQRVVLSVAGAAVQQVVMCGNQQLASVAGERAVVGVRIISSLGTGLRNAQLVIDRCANGRWHQVRSDRLGTLDRGDRARRYDRALDTSSAGDFRISLRRGYLRGDRPRPLRASPHVHAVYLRVGVGEIVDSVVSFKVDNVNRSGVPCLTDGKAYTVRGHLVAPRSALSSDHQSLTVYLHGGVIGELWYFTGVPGYNHLREMARLGHASLTFSQLGYHPSDLPNGDQTCIGSDADVAHQVIAQLRAGRYQAQGLNPPSFQRIALAGLSEGSVRAAVEAFSFRDIDALIQLGMGLEFSPRATLVGTQWGIGCFGPGAKKRPDGPAGYIDYDTERSGLIRNEDIFFYNADPAVENALFDEVEQDPCESAPTILMALQLIALRRREISVPVLIMNGDHEGLFIPVSPQAQARQYTASHDVTAIELRDSGHVLVLQRTAPEFRAHLSRWLSQRGF